MMSKRTAIVAGLVLALVPGAASGQAAPDRAAERGVGASFRVRGTVEQPSLVAAPVGSGGQTAWIPAGWAWAVSRGVGGGAGSPPRVLESGLARAAAEVALPALPPGATARIDDHVTWVFTPL